MIGYEVDIPERDENGSWVAYLKVPMTSDSFMTARVKAPSQTMLMEAVRMAIKTIRIVERGRHEDH